MRPPARGRGVQVWPNTVLDRGLAFSVVPHAVNIHQLCLATTDVRCLGGDPQTEEDM
jgi:hypothetical protein